MTTGRRGGEAPSGSPIRRAIRAVIGLYLAWLWPSSISLAEINPPVAVSNLQSLPPRPLDVLVYYANETSLNEEGAQNYQAILGWLTSSGKPQTLKVAEQIKRDVQVFPSVVDSELAEIESALPGSPIGGRTAVVAFTNRLSRRGLCLVLEPGQANFRPEPFRAAMSKDYILSGSPLSRVESFELAIAKTAALFSPGMARYTLVVKSHGSDLLALTPRLSVRHEATTPEELVGVVMSEGQPLTKTPDWVAHRLGTTKRELFGALSRAAGSRGMVFPVMFIDACRSELRDTEDLKLGHGTIGRLFTTHGESPYSNLSYRAILQYATTTLSAALDSALVDKGRAARFTSRSSALPRPLYYLPLAGWIVVVALSAIRRRHQPAGPK